MLKKTPHLTPEEILTLAEGQALGSDVREHLLECLECVKQVEQARYTVVSLPRERGDAAARRAVVPQESLLGKSARAVRRLTERLGVGSPSEHPPSDVLLALVYDALSPKSTQGVHHHLRSCDACLARFEKARQNADPFAGDPSSRGVMARAKDRLRRMTPPLPAERLGRLIVQWAGGLDAARFTFVPVEGPAALQLTDMGLMQEEIRGTLDRRFEPATESGEVPAARPHPSSAQARRARALKRDRDATAKQPPVRAIEAAVPASPAAEPGGADRARSPARPSNLRASESALIETAPFALRVSATRDGKGQSLEVTVLDLETRAEVRDLRVVIQVNREGWSRSRTDDHGRFSFAVPNRHFEIRLGEEGQTPAWSLEVQIVD